MSAMTFAYFAEVATIDLENPSTNLPKESWQKQAITPLFVLVANGVLALPAKEASI